MYRYRAPADWLVLGSRAIERSAVAAKAAGEAQLWLLADRLASLPETLERPSERGLSAREEDATVSDSGDNDLFEGIEEVLELFHAGGAGAAACAAIAAPGGCIPGGICLPVWSSRATWHKSALTDFRLTNSLEIAVCRDGSFSREAAQEFSPGRAKGRYVPTGMGSAPVRRGAACCAQNSNPLSGFQIGSKGVRCPLHGVATFAPWSDVGRSMPLACPNWLFPER